MDPGFRADTCDRFNSRPVESPSSARPSRSDELVSISEVAVVESSFDDVVRRLSAASRPLTLVFAKAPVALGDADARAAAAARDVASHVEACRVACREAEEALEAATAAAKDGDAAGTADARRAVDAAAATAKRERALRVRRFAPRSAIVGPPHRGRCVRDDAECVKWTKGACARAGVPLNAKFTRPRPSAAGGSRGRRSSVSDRWTWRFPGRPRVSDS